MLFGLKIGHKIPPRRSQDAHMTPQDGPRRPKTALGRLQDGSKTTPRRLPDSPRYRRDAPKTALNYPKTPKMLPRRPKTTMDPSKTPPDIDFNASMLDFFWFLHEDLLIFGSFGDHVKNVVSYQITSHCIPSLEDRRRRGPI